MVFGRYFGKARGTKMPEEKKIRNVVSDRLLTALNSFLELGVSSKTPSGLVRNLRITNLACLVICMIGMALTLSLYIFYGWSSRANFIVEVLLSSLSVILPVVLNAF